MSGKKAETQFITTTAIAAMFSFRSGDADYIFSIKPNCNCESQKNKHFQLPVKCIASAYKSKC